MSAPKMRSIPVSNSPLHKYGSVVSQTPVEFHRQSKVLSICVKARCSKCGHLNKHGIPIDPMIHASGDVLTETRGCDGCGLDYSFLVRL